MGAHEARVETDIIVPGIIDEVGEDALPHTGLRPSCEAFVGGLPFAVALGKIVPMRARAQHPKHAVDESKVITPRPARITGLAGQQMLDPPPLFRRQFVPLGLRHHGPPDQ